MKKYITTVRDARTVWLEESKRRGLRPATIKSYRNQSEYVVKAFGNKRMAFVSPEKAKEWLFGLDVSPESKRDIKRVTDQIWRHYGAVPLFGKKVRIKSTVRIDFYTVEEAGELLRLAEPELRGYIALGLFCGIRPTELLRLNDLEAVSNPLSELGIRIDASIAKNLISRFVDPVEDTWKGFARAYPCFGIRNIGRRLRRLGRISPFPLIPNGLRHSFATYYYALHGASETARVLGHRSPDVLFQYYAGVTDREQAKRYFGIKPSGGVR